MFNNEQPKEEKPKKEEKAEEIILEIPNVVQVPIQKAKMRSLKEYSDFLPPITGTKIRAYVSASEQVIPDTTATKVTLDGESWDVLGEFATNRFTAKRKGKCDVTAAVLWKTSVDQKVFQVYIYKNNAEVARDARPTSGTGVLSCSARDTVDLEVGDYIEMFVYQNSGGNISLLNGSAYTYLTINKIN